MKRTLLYIAVVTAGLAATVAHFHVSTHGRPVLAVPLLICAVGVMALREWMMHRK